MSRRLVRAPRLRGCHEVSRFAPGGGRLRRSGLAIGFGAARGCAPNGLAQALLKHSICPLIAIESVAGRGHLLGFVAGRNGVVIFALVT